MTSLNDIIDVIGDKIFSPTITTNNRNRLQQVMYEKRREKTFEDTLFDESKKYDKKYNTKRATLKRALHNRELLKIKTEENNKLINSLVTEIKSLNYKPNDDDNEDELIRILAN